MQKYFVSDIDWANKAITGDDIYHIRTVMRNKINDEIIVSNNGKSYLAKLTSVNNLVTYDIIEEINGNSELPFFVALFQGYPKGDKLEDIIKHGTELGIKSFNPVIMERTIVKIDEKKIATKTSRFNKIAKEAAEQSNRDIVPVVFSPTKLLKTDFSSYDIKILCNEETAKSHSKNGFKALVKQIKSDSRIAIVVGPEGGVSPKEVSYLEENGFVSVALGPRILRTETVVFYCLSAISYEMELD